MLRNIQLDTKKNPAISTFTIDQYVNRNKNLAKFYRGGKLTIKALSNKSFEIQDVSDLPNQIIPEEVVLDDALTNWLFICKTDYEPQGNVEKKAMERISKISNLICESDVPVFVKDTWKLSDSKFHDEIVKHLYLAQPVTSLYRRSIENAIEIGHFYTSKEIEEVMMEARRKVWGQYPQTLTINLCLKYFRYLFEIRYTSQRIDNKTVNGYMIQEKRKSKYKLIPVTDPYTFPEDLP